MKKLSELVNFYYEEIYKELIPIEKQRIEIERKLKNAIFYIAMGSFFSFYLIFKSGFLGNAIEPYVIVGFGAFALYGFYYKTIVIAYNKSFKNKVISKIILFLNPEFEYFASSYVLQKDFESSQIFTAKPQRYSGNDFASGKVEGVEIKFSDIKAEHKTDGKNNKDDWHTIFEGIFFIADFHKNFKGLTIAMPQSGFKGFEFIGDLFSKIDSRGELVKLDNPDFEKNFRVLGTDQIEARYILSHSLMERILKLKNKIGKPIYLSFYDSKVFIAIEFGKDQLEPSIFKSLKEFGVFREYLEVLSNIFGIVEDLKLNIKIWDKR